MIRHTCTLGKGQDHVKTYTEWVRGSCKFSSLKCAFQYTPLKFYFSKKYLCIKIAFISVYFFAFIYGVKKIIFACLHPSSIKQKLNKFSYEKQRIFFILILCVQEVLTHYTYKLQFIKWVKTIWTDSRWERIFYMGDHIYI